MQVSNPNNIKIYNLSAGRSLPDWLSDKKRRKLQQQDVDIRRRIELLQDFSMPHVSNLVRVTNDGQYVLATGTYKPRLRVYDTNMMSMKYEKCLDSHAIQMLTLESDYSKVVILQEDRFIEFHHKYGKLFRTRIPRYGRDMAYHAESCDLYLTAYGNEIYRLNLEQGKFLNPLKTSSVETTCCQFNPQHQLFTCGTAHGQVECWDPRSRFRVGLLDCSLTDFTDGNPLEEIPKVTALTYKDGLNLAVGTSTGQILLYDIRSPKALLVKDHHYDLPIKSIQFQDKEDIVISMDKRIVKMWHRNTGAAYTHIEPEETSLNDLCVVPDTGLMFIANEAPKILSYYVPSIGPAPRWCSFLDNITEELEETMTSQVYDDYKFVTRTELEDMNLSQLIGTDLLRGYMHGFFMDIRLYKKAKGASEPFAYDDFRKRKVKEKIAEDRESRIMNKSELPKINRELAQKLLLNNTQAGNALMKDERFSSLFKNADFSINKDSGEYRLTSGNLTRIEDKHKKQQEKLQQKFIEVDNVEVKPPKKKNKTEDIIKTESESGEKSTGPVFYEIKDGDSVTDINKPTKKNKKSKMALGERVEEIDNKDDVKRTSGFGAKEMTFTSSKEDKIKKRKFDSSEHRKERAKLRRPAGKLMKAHKKSTY